MKSDNRFPALSNYLKWKFGSSNASCISKYSGRLLHSFMWKYASDGLDFSYEKARNYIAGKCPFINGWKLEKIVARMHLQFFNFQEWLEGKNNILISPSRLCQIGNAYMYVKPDFISPNAVYDIKFYPPVSFKKNKRIWDEAVIYHVSYAPLQARYVFVSIHGFKEIKINPSNDEVERVKNDVEKFYMEWKKGNIQ